jgi:parvulin-like peptidyl-prolyl isomerase
MRIVHRHSSSLSHPLRHLPAILLLVSSAIASEDPRPLLADGVRLGGVRPESVEDIALLYPADRGVVAVYGDGEEAWVHDAGAMAGPATTMIRRAGHEVVVHDVRHYRWRVRMLGLAGINDPTTGEAIDLHPEEWEPRLLCGEPGREVAMATGVIRFDGVEQVEIGERSYRCARVSFLPADGPATRRVWVELGTGVLVLEAIAPAGSSSWRARRILERTSRIDPLALGRGEHVELVRTEVLGLGARTIREPTDPEVVPEVDDAEIDPARLPTTPRVEPARIRLARIIVAGAPKRDPGAAAARARKLCRLARARGVDFGEVARFYSDAPDRHGGGEVGARDHRDRENDPLTAAGFALEVGQVSDPVELEGGLGIVTRLELDELAAARIVIGFVGSRRPLAGAGVRVTRSRAEAEELVAECLRRLEHGKDFHALAREVSETPERRNGGRLGIFAPWEHDAAAVEVVSGLALGEVGGPVEILHGLALYRREPVERIRATIVRIGWEGGNRIGRGSGRSEEEALQRALEVADLMRSPGVDLAELARAYSDAASVDRDGGDTGLLDAARVPPSLGALRDIAVGEVYGPEPYEGSFLVMVRTR